MEDSVIVIPARYGSSRLPGKPLADINGKSMIQWVYERAKQPGGPLVVVATDDDRILNAVNSFGGMAVMTSEEHQSGTMRIAEVAKMDFLKNYKYFINIQGDQPTLDSKLPSYFDLRMKENLAPNDISIFTLITQIEDEDELKNPSVAKVVLNAANEAMYFSRSPIPYNQSGEHHIWPYKHVGIYGYTRVALEKIETLYMSDLEKTEKLEQLNWLYHGIKVKTGIAPYVNKISVDTPADLEKVREMLR